MNKTVFLVNVDPFAGGAPEYIADDYIDACELVEEREDVYLTHGMYDIVRYPHELYTAFDTRDEALLHLERIVLNKTQELEGELGKWQHFINALDDELRKS